VDRESRVFSERALVEFWPREVLHGEFDGELTDRELLHGEFFGAVDRVSEESRGWRG